MKRCAFLLCVEILQTVCMKRIIHSFDLSGYALNAKSIDMLAMREMTFFVGNPQTV